MSTVAVVNVRMGSSRLPGKVLRSICGKPLLRHLLDRLALATTLDRVVVATSVLPCNDVIASFCENEAIPCFRGSEDDVLGRTLGALRAVGARSGVIVFGDGPLVDPAIVDRVVRAYCDSNPAYDFVGNDLKTTYPPGMEVEALSVEALADADLRCEDPAVREHGTLYVRHNPDRYRLLNLEAPPNLARPDLELEVDVEEDLCVMAAVVSNFSGRPEFALADIIEFLDAHPEISATNRAIVRRWKAHRSDG